MELLSGANGLFAYALVFGVLVACGLGVPMPEDVSLILGGFLAYQGSANLWVMMGVGFAGILFGDSLIFFAGRRLGTKVGRGGGFFARVVTPEKRAKVEGLFARHGEKIVMLARFLPGVRAVTYFTAGSAGMRYLRFILFDGLAAILSAPFFVWLGFKFGGELQTVIDTLKEGQLYVFAALAVMGLGYVLYRRACARKASALAALEPVLGLGREGGAVPAVSLSEKAPRSSHG
jgi:membrane protein DedA with SNARE-associated domain